MDSKAEALDEPVSIIALTPEENEKINRASKATSLFSLRDNLQRKIDDINAQLAELKVADKDAAVAQQVTADVRAALQKNGLWQQ